MYSLWLHGLYGLYGPRCPLSPNRPINLISLSVLDYHKIMYTRQWLRCCAMCNRWSNGYSTVTGVFPKAPPQNCKKKMMNYSEVGISWSNFSEKYEWITALYDANLDDYSLQPVFSHCISHFEDGIFKTIFYKLNFFQLNFHLSLFTRFWYFLVLNVQSRCTIDNESALGLTTKPGIIQSTNGKFH